MVHRHLWIIWKAGSPRRGVLGTRLLLATAAESPAMADLIGKYPAEAQLIMTALEDGLTLGAMRVADHNAQAVDFSDDVWSR